MSFRTKARANSFKKGLDRDDARRKRADSSLNLRKSKRDENLMKRRQIKPAVTNENVASLGNQKQLTVQERLDMLPQLVQAVNSNDTKRQVEATTHFRKLLSVEKNPPIDRVIETGVVPRLIQFLTSDQNHKLQFEAAWTLTNIASGTTKHTECVIAKGAVPIFVRLLASPNDDVAEQAVWALGNIAGDSPSNRDKVIGCGAVQALLGVLNDRSQSGMIRNATWCISNLCRGKPQPPFEPVSAALPALKVLLAMDDAEVLVDACWAVSYLSDDNEQENAKIQAVVQSGVVPLLVQRLMHSDSSIQTPALRALGNIVTGNDMQTQAVMNTPGFAQALGSLMSNKKKSIRKEACWTASNVMAGNHDQITSMFQANLVAPLINCLKHDEFDVRKEACWAICNATSEGNVEHLKYLATQGSIDALCSMFDSTETRILQVAMEGLENILKCGEKLALGGDNEYANMVEECGGLDHIEDLQQHENEGIYEKAVKLLKDYFDSETDEEEMAPGVENNQFAFGTTNNAPAAFAF